MSLIKFTGYKSNSNNINQLELKQYEGKLVRQTEREYKIIQKTETHKTEEFNKIFQIQFHPKYSLTLFRQFPGIDEFESMLLPVGMAYAVYLVPDLMLFMAEKAAEYSYYRERGRKI